MRLRIACVVAFVTLFVQGEGARDHLRALVNHNVLSGEALEKGCNGKGGKCSRNQDCCDPWSCGGGGKCGGCNADGVKCDTDGDCCDGLYCHGGKCTTTPSPTGKPTAPTSSPTVLTANKVCITNKLSGDGTLWLNLFRASGGASGTFALDGETACQIVTIDTTYQTYVTAENGMAATLSTFALGTNTLDYTCTGTAQTWTCKGELVPTSSPLPG
jgi:hypothetical protein